MQLNNWNETKKESNKELQLYSDLLNDLDSEYSKSESHINEIKSYDRFHVHLYNEMSGKAEYDPIQNYDLLLWKKRYLMFISEKYSESFSHITHKDIHKALKNYISKENDTKEAVEEWNDYHFQSVRPYLNRHNITSTKAMFNQELDEFAEIINSTNLIDHSKLEVQFQSEEFEQLLFLIRFKTLWMNQNFIWLNNASRELQLILTKELTSKNFEGNYEIIEPITLREFIIIGKTTEKIIEILVNEVNNGPVYNFSEGEINSFGYDLMDDNKDNEALKVFELNIQLYPNQWNTYDSYGECLLKLGDIENATKAYKKALELNPANTGASEALKRIKNISEQSK